jgi:hypothetical protein
MVIDPKSGQRRRGNKEDARRKVVRQADAREKKRIMAGEVTKNTDS